MSRVQDWEILWWTIVELYKFIMLPNQEEKIKNNIQDFEYSQKITFKYKIKIILF